MSQRTKIKALLQTEDTGFEVTVKGWVRTFRNNQFIALNDGSTNNNLQIVVALDSFGDDLLKRITTGAAISVTGEVVPSLGKGQKVEVKAKTLEILGDCDPTTYPIQPKKHSLEFLRDNAHLRFRTNTFGAVFRVRNSLSFAVHQFFQERGFVYLHTPVITASDAEGAGETFRVTTLDPIKPPLTETGEVDFKQDFFGKATNLTVSGQLEGELGAMALSDIYTFGPTFRAENSNTTRHLAEFWMIEPEMAFYNLNDNMDLAEALLKYVIAYALKHNADDIEFLKDRLLEEEKQKPQQDRSELNLLEKLQFCLDNDFERLTYTEAIDYMRQNDDGKTVRAMDILFPGIGEIVGGSQREERLDKLEQRMNEMGIPTEELWWYLDTRRFGACEHAGFGLGFERLVLFVTGMGNIRDVIPFPRAPKTAEF